MTKFTAKLVAKVVGAAWFAGAAVVGAPVVAIACGVAFCYGAGLFD